MKQCNFKDCRYNRSDKCSSSFKYDNCKIQACNRIEEFIEDELEGYVPLDENDVHFAEGMAFMGNEILKRIGD